MNWKITQISQIDTIFTIALKVVKIREQSSRAKGYNVEGITVSDGPNPVCLNLLHRIVQPIKT